MCKCRCWLVRTGRNRTPFASEQLPQFLCPFINHPSDQSAVVITGGRHGTRAVVHETDAPCFRGRQAATSALPHDTSAAATKVRSRGGCQSLTRALAICRCCGDLHHRADVAHRCLKIGVAGLLEGAGHIGRCVLDRAWCASTPCSCSLVGGHLAAQRRAQGMLAGELNVRCVSTPLCRRCCTGSNVLQKRLLWRQEVFCKPLRTLRTLLLDLVSQGSSIRIPRGRWARACCLPLARPLLLKHGGTLFWPRKVEGVGRPLFGFLGHLKLQGLVEGPP
mmetsp:Transcript_16237/g.38086  ORF Transcript_16237/g.38086 Transcript_16237/m.38086 type:complete len:277 (-) Transcript_16237:285-1115(-)